MQNLHASIVSVCSGLHIPVCYVRATAVLLYNCHSCCDVTYFIVLLLTLYLCQIQPLYDIGTETRAIDTSSINDYNWLLMGFVIFGFS